MKATWSVCSVRFDRGLTGPVEAGMWLGMSVDERPGSPQPFLMSTAKLGSRPVFEFAPDRGVLLTIQAHSASETALRSASVSEVETAWIGSSL